VVFVEVGTAHQLRCDVNNRRVVPQKLSGYNEFLQ